MKIQEFKEGFERELWTHRRQVMLRQDFLGAHSFGVTSIKGTGIVSLLNGYESIDFFYETNEEQEVTRVYAIVGNIIEEIDLDMFEKIWNRQRATNIAHNANHPNYNRITDSYEKEIMYHRDQVIDGEEVFKDYIENIFITYMSQEDIQSKQMKPYEQYLDFCEKVGELRTKRLEALEEAASLR